MVRKGRKGLPGRACPSFPQCSCYCHSRRNEPLAASSPAFRGKTASPGCVWVIKRFPLFPGEREREQTHWGKGRHTSKQPEYRCQGIPWLTSVAHTLIHLHAHVKRSSGTFVPFRRKLLRDYVSQWRLPGCIYEIFTFPWRPIAYRGISGKDRICSD